MESTQPNAPARPGKLRRLAGRVGALSGKALLLFVIIGVLNVGVGMVAALVNERESRFQAVSREVSATWGRAQTIAGPVLAVPYGIAGELPGPDNAVVQGTIYLLPATLDIDASIDPQIRQRGIFEAVVYSSSTTLEGRFDLSGLTAPEPASAGEPPPMLLWERASVVVGVPDMRSIRSAITIAMGGSVAQFAPGTPGDLFDSGMSAALPADALPARAVLDGELDAAGVAASVPLRFAMTLDLDGSRSLELLPLGEQTRVAMRSPWPDPSFSGAFLPAERSVSEAGFEAAWALSNFSRAYPQRLDSEELAKGTRDALAQSAFGVRLYQPVTTYRKVQRATKYGLLFIVFTFGVYFLVELTSGKPVHPVQYALVGVPLCLFFLLLVAFAEHIGFNRAYVAGAAAVVVLVGSYSLKVLRRRGRAATVAALLGGLYAYLYLLLQQESYSLLGGALGLLALTAAFMWATRDIDWYTPGHDRSNGAGHGDSNGVLAR